MKKSLALAAFLGLAASASAYTVTYNDSVIVAEGINTVLSLPKFNLPGYTLQSVTISIQLTVPSFLTEVDNDLSNAADGNIVFGTLGGVVFSSSVPTDTVGLADEIDSNDFFITTQQSPVSVTGTTGDDLNNFNTPPDVPATLGDYAAFTTAPVLVGAVDHPVWSILNPNYVGAGDFDMTINVDLTSGFNLTSGGGGTGTVIRFQGEVPVTTYFGSVTYEYIPEPSTAVLFGLVGAGMMVRRRRA